MQLTALQIRIVLPTSWWHLVYSLKKSLEDRPSFLGLTLRTSAPLLRAYKRYRNVFFCTVSSKLGLQFLTGHVANMT